MLWLVIIGHLYIIGVEWQFEGLLTNMLYSVGPMPKYSRFLITGTGDRSADIKVLAAE